MGADHYHGLGSVRQNKFYGQSYKDRPGRGETWLKAFWRSPAFF